MDLNLVRVGRQGRSRCAAYVKIVTELAAQNSKEPAEKCYPTAGDRVLSAAHCLFRVRGFAAPFGPALFRIPLSESDPCKSSARASHRRAKPAHRQHAAFAARGPGAP